MEFMQEQLRCNSFSNLGVSYDQSLGSVSYPSNFHLLPEARLSFVSGKIWPALFYLVATSLLYSVTFLLSQIICQNSRVSLYAAGLFVLAVMPFTSPPILTELYWWHAPFMIPAVYFHSLVLCAIFLLAKSREFSQTILCLILGTGIWIWMFVAYIKASVPVSLSLLTYLLPLFFFADGRGKINLLAFSAVSFIACLGLGIFSYTSNIYNSSATVLLDGAFGGPLSTAAKLIDLVCIPKPLHLLIPYLGIQDPLVLLKLNEQVVHPLSQVVNSLAWIKYQFGYFMPAASIGVAVGLLLFWHRSENQKPQTCLIRPLCVGYLLNWLTAPFQSYGCNNPLSSFNLAFLILVIGAEKLLQVFPPTSRHILKIKLSGLLALVLFFALYPSAPPVGYNEKKQTELIRILQNSTGFSLQQEFRGRVWNSIQVEKTSRENPSFSAPANLINMAYQLAVRHGNDLTYSGLRAFQIPSLFEYNRMQSPAVALFENYFLSGPTAQERIDYRTPNVTNIPILKMMGVSKIISDRKLDTADLVLMHEEDLGEFGEAYLYQVKNPNLGHYAPKKVILKKTFLEILQSVEAGKNSLEEIAFVDTPQTMAPMNVPDKVVITRIQDGLHVSSSSRGASLLLLPFEYSHVYQLRTTQLSGPARLLRLNGLFLGIYFQGKLDADIIFQYTLASGPKERALDIRDWERLNLFGAMKEIQKQKSARGFFGGRY